MNLHRVSIFKTRIIKRGLIVAVSLMTSLLSFHTYAEPNIDEIQWKSESKVESMLGTPNSVRGPIGTHASYTLWQYDDYTVAFSNGRAFHVFDKDSLKRFELNQGGSN